MYKSVNIEIGDQDRYVSTVKLQVNSIFLSTWRGVALAWCGMVDLYKLKIIRLF